jgi:hypothetical protein
MKGIKRTLVAGFLACSALQAQAVDNPWGGGVKGGLVTNYLRVGEGTKINGGKDIETKYKLFGNGRIYGEYVFCDYVGAQLGVGYRRDGGILKEKGATDENATVSMMAHGVAVPLAVYFYPLGREEGEGMLTVHLGGSVFFPLIAQKLNKGNTTIDTNTLSDNQKKELSGWDYGAHLGWGWQFPFGLILEAEYGINFRNRFSLEEGKNQTVLPGISNLKKLGTSYGNVNVGYNLASLFTE